MNLYRFKTECNYYVYDVYTNHILKVDKQTWLACSEASLERHSQNNGASTDPFTPPIGNRIIELRRRFGVIPEKFPSCPVRITPDSSSIVHALNNHLEILLLNVTEVCNFRCTYCVYGGAYPLRRGHSDRIMSFDVARRAVDFFLQRSEHAKTPSIAFYGGEPLSALTLIKEIVRYVQSQTSRIINYSITTNGSLLSDDAVEFFVRNNFSLLISLDGPGRIHDRYRKTRSGKDTFETIIGNIHRIRAKHKDYFYTRVGYSITLVPPFELNAVLDFFSNESLFGENSILLGLVNTEDVRTIFTDDEVNRFLRDYRGQYKMVMEWFFDKLNQENLSQGEQLKFNLIKSAFLGPFTLIHHRALFPLVYCPANGVCIPGARKLFVSCDGKFYPCEKMDNRYEIGNIDDGLDMTAVLDLINIYTDICEYLGCSDCWARRICPKCYLSMYSGNTISAEYKKASCASVRRYRAKQLIDYCKMMEINPSIFAGTRVG